jgi:hypothetical protein
VCDIFRSTGMSIPVVTTEIIISYHLVFVISITRFGPSSPYGHLSLVRIPAVRPLSSSCLPHPSSLFMDQHSHLVPPPPPPPSQSETSLPTFAKSIPVEIATLPASTRTSFTRVDNTRPGSSTTDQRDEMVTGPSVDSDGAPELPPPPPSQNDEQPEAAAPPPPPVPQVPQTLLQFLLVSGRRRSMAFEPETTVGRVKELVWNSWPSGTFQLSPSYHTHALSISRLPTPPGVILFFFIVVPSTERRFTSATRHFLLLSSLSFCFPSPLFFSWWWY